MIPPWFKISACFLLLSSPLLAQTQQWEVFDYDFNLVQRLNNQEFTLLGEAVRVSKTDKQLKLLNQSYKPFLSLKGEEIYQYLSPWIITKSDDQKMGVYHEYGEEIFSTEFDQIEVLNHQILVEKEGQFQLYQHSNRSIATLGKFTAAYFAPNGHVIGLKDTVFFLPSSKLDQGFELLQVANESFIIAKESSGYGIINRYGKYIMDPILDHLESLGGNYFYAYDGRQHMLIKANNDLAHISYTSYHKITVEEGLILEYIHGKLRRIMKQDGILLDMAGMESVNKMGEDHFLVHARENKVGLLNKQGKWEVAPVKGVDRIYPGKNGLYPAEKLGQFGYLDKSGNWVIEAQFESAQVFSENLAAVKSNGVWGYINPLGEWVIPAGHGAAGPFHKGLALVRQGAKYNLTDPTGRLILDEYLSNIYLQDQDFFLTEEEGLFGMLSPEGLTISPPKFEFLQRVDQNKILVRMQDRFGILADSGEVNLPVYYKKIYIDETNKKVLAETEMHLVNKPVVVLPEKKSRK
ncbi:WG repeat-containing protein [Pararhodonellum marinum]|uniref:WG repeat-containing protein n=1 Tax=Pararhodonellum marinum TaxID=2755358 RepID=UPI00188F576D|nr:WG repeat-containing protein [Pararhodonellum marinum]